jgi:hypothetical protein
MIRRNRTIAALALALAVGAIPALDARAAPRPARMGTIIDGLFLMGPGSTPGCTDSPDCALWLAAGCPPELAGRDPAVEASIVNVSDLANGAARRFTVDRSEPYSLEWGEDVVVELWTKDCRRIPYAGWTSKEWVGYGQWESKHATMLTIPPDATWMTVVPGYDNLNIDWRLY